MRYRYPGRSTGVKGRSPVPAGAQHGSNGPSWDKSGIGGTFDELSPGRGERGVDTGRCPAEPAEVQAASGQQHYPGSKCRRRGDYPRIPAPPAWESTNQEELTGPAVAEASPAKLLGGILGHLNPVQTSEGPACIGRHTSGMRHETTGTAGAG